MLIKLYVVKVPLPVDNESVEVYNPKTKKTKLVNVGKEGAVVGGKLKYDVYDSLHNYQDRIEVQEVEVPDHLLEEYQKNGWIEPAPVTDVAPIKKADVKTPETVTTVEPQIFTAPLAEGENFETK